MTTFTNDTTYNIDRLNGFRHYEVGEGTIPANESSVSLAILFEKAVEASGLVQRPDYALTDNGNIVATYLNPDEMWNVEFNPNGAFEVHFWTPLIAGDPTSGVNENRVFTSAPAALEYLFSVLS